MIIDGFHNRSIGRFYRSVRLVVVAVWRHTLATFGRRGSLLVDDRPELVAVLFRVEQVHLLVYAQQPHRVRTILPIAVYRIANDLSRILTKEQF